MTSMNDSLTPDLLFNIFKRLDCFETTVVRRVCKQWFEIIDEHKTFWRTLHLPEKSHEWDHSILELFDGKSESSLQDVDIGVGVREVQQAQIIDTLKKSKAHLKHLFLTFKSPIGPVWKDLLKSCSAMQSFRLLRWHYPYKVHLRRKSNRSDSQEDGPNHASLLKVLWYYGADRFILEINNAKFNNLVSLDIGSILSPSEWRDLLEVPSKSLKHLRIGFRNGKHEDHGGIPTLCLPSIEVLELSNGGSIPPWLLIPDTAKLITHGPISNLPSISALWAWDPRNHQFDISSRLPKLETVCLRYVYELKLAVKILNERNSNVEAGLQVGGVKMEMIKILILPFELSRTDHSEELERELRECRELVEVVEGNARERFIEVEV